MAQLNEAARTLQINRERREVMDGLPHGVSVVSADLRLVAWNQRYVELFDYPPGFVYAGRPIADLILFNARRGWCGPGDPQRHTERRVAFLRIGTSHTSERRLPNGRVIEVCGQRLPDGGFVTTFSDITRFKRVEADLRELNQTLEQRVTMMVEAVRTVLAGESWMPPPPAALERPHGDGARTVDASESEAAVLVSRLTPQQFRVLVMLCSGRQNKQIALQLNVTEATVKAHMRAIMEKFGASNRTQVVLVAQRLSLADQSDLASSTPPRAIAKPTNCNGSSVSWKKKYA